MKHIIFALAIGVVSVHCIRKRDINAHETSEKMKHLYHSKLARSQLSHKLLLKLNQSPYYTRHAPQMRPVLHKQPENTIATSAVKKHSIRSARGKALSLVLPSKEKPFEYYKVLVVVAPPEVRMSSRGLSLVIYIVFPEDDDGVTEEVPTVYFVTTRPPKPAGKKTPPAEPILIIDNNRKVTGLKSKQIAKYVTFKNKLSLNDTLTAFNNA